MNLGDALPKVMADALPASMRDLPLAQFIDPPGLKRLLALDRPSRFRRVDYRCARRHQLAQVLASPEGALLMLKTDGLARQPQPKNWAELSAAGRRAHRRITIRTEDEVYSLDALRQWRSLPGSFETDLVCRCGRHPFDCYSAIDDHDSGRAYVVLRQSAGTAL